MARKSLVQPERCYGASRAIPADRTASRLGWCVAVAVVLSIGLDPSLTLWREAASGVLPDFRTVSISASDIALLFLIGYGWWPRRVEPAGGLPLVGRAIAWSGAVLVGCLTLSMLAAGLPWLSLMRTGQVALGLLACLALARHRSLADRVLVASAGMILLQLPQVIVQEIRQSSLSLGSPIPGWPPITDARVPGALVVFGPSNLRWQRGMGSFLHPNLLGAFLALSLVLFLPWLARGGRSCAALWPVWAIAWGELLLTFSRAALAAALIGCLVWGIGRYRHTASAKQLVILLSAPAAAVVGAALGVGSVLAPRLDPVGVMHTVAVTDRLRLAELGARVVRSHPLLGVGPGRYSVAVAGLPHVGITAQPVHVVPLLITAEAGLVAGLAWLALVAGGPLAELCIGWRRERITIDRLAIPIVILILALLDHYFWSFAPGQALFWVMLGVWASRSPFMSHRDSSHASIPCSATDTG